MLPDPAAERRAIRRVRAAGTAVLVLAVVLLAIAPRTAVRANLPGFRDPVLGLELVTAPAEVLDILGHPGDAARAETVRRMRLVTRLDFLFLLAYPAFHAAIAALLAARGRLANATARTVGVLALAMAVGDAIENLQILALLDTTDAAAMAAPLGRLRPATALKWAALFTAAAVLAAGVRREQGWWRWTAPLFALGAACGFAAVVHPPALEWGVTPSALAWSATYVRSWGRFATPAPAVAPPRAV